MTVAALLCVIALSHAACTQPMNATPRPDYRENPRPQQAYRLTMTIENAPGPFKIIASAAQYDVVNTECLPAPKENAGGRSSPVPTNDIPFELTRVSENQYVGVVHLDGMIDEDYHGRGVCRWELIQAQVQLKATGAGDETRFIASMSRRDDAFRFGQAKKLYYWKGRYPQSDTRDFPSFGETDPATYKPDIRNDLFAITLEVEEATP